MITMHGEWLLCAWSFFFHTFLWWSLALNLVLIFYVFLSLICWIIVTWNLDYIVPKVDIFFWGVEWSVLDSKVTLLHTLFLIWPFSPNIPSFLDFIILCFSFPLSIVTFLCMLLEYLCCAHWYQGISPPHWHQMAFPPSVRMVGG